LIIIRIRHSAIPPPTFATMAREFISQDRLGWLSSSVGGSNHEWSLNYYDEFKLAFSCRALLTIND